MKPTSTTALKPTQRAGSIPQRRGGLTPSIDATSRIVNNYLADADGKPVELHGVAIQNLADAKAHMVTDIKDVAISNGHNSTKLNAAHANGNISIGSIADVYGVGKIMDRKKGGLRYAAGEMAYKFDYSQKDSGESYSTQETDYSNRDMLANAFEGITKDSEEYALVQEYKGRIKLLNEQEEKLAKLNAEIRKLRFGTPGPRDAAKLSRLEADAKKAAQAINRHDKKLLSLEASEPLRKVIERERKKDVRKTKEHVKEIQQNKKLRAEQTELRHKICKAVRDLDKILKHGDKKRHVKEDMKGFASKALELADYLFTDHISNDELIRKGITVRMTPEEAALVKETEEIVSQLYDNVGSLTAEEYERLDAKRKRNMTENERIEFDKKVTEANWKLVESVASFFGIPVKNVRREIIGVIDHAGIASANAGKTTAQSTWDTICDAMIDSLPLTWQQKDALYLAHGCSENTIWDVPW